jgi:hypothetical protein
VPITLIVAALQEVLKKNKPAARKVKKPLLELADAIYLLFGKKPKGD